MSIKEQDHNPIFPTDDNLKFVLLLNKNQQIIPFFAKLRWNN